MKHSHTTAPSGWRTPPDIRPDFNFLVVWDYTSTGINNFHDGALCKVGTAGDGDSP